MSITFSYLLLEHVSYVYRAITKKYFEITVIKIWINQFCKKRKKRVKCYYSCLILDDTAITSIKNIKDVKCGTYFFEGGSEGLLLPRMGV